MSLGANSGVLYVVATPIGNFTDMVPRAVETLQQVALIAAEDTRHSARLMSEFDIKTPMTAYHDHSDDKRTGQIVEKLLAGDDVALISDAGTPLVSDPGYQLVRAAREANVQVVPIPGACALVAALAASGLPSDRFTFEGFLPAKSGQRQNALRALVEETRTLIFYEAPHRILATVADMVEVFGSERELVLARELTKTFETIYSASASELHEFIAGDSNQQRGEIVLLVRGADKKQDSSLSPEIEHMMSVLMRELPLKQASTLAAEITGLKKKQLYQWGLDQQKDAE